MAAQLRALTKLREYASKAKDAEYDMGNTDGEVDYEIRLNKTLRHLQDQVQQQEAALEKLRATNNSHPPLNEPAQDPPSRIHQLRTITAAYNSLTPTSPLLPSPDSPLPSLLALRKTISLIDETKTSLKTNDLKLTESQTLLRQENDDFRHAHLMSAALEARVEKLRLEYEGQAQKSPEDMVRELMHEQQQRKIFYRKELRKLVRAFNRFVEEYLAGMLAVEELGGPVVGDMIDVDDAVLSAGFSHEGRAKKPKTVASQASQGDVTKRKQRIEEIWGPKGNDNDSEEEDEDTIERSEKGAACADFRTLTEDLLNAAAGEGRDEDGYVRLGRETASMRFLVRAKVAQFDPEDARRLKLVDLGEQMGD